MQVQVYATHTKVANEGGGNSDAAEDRQQSAAAAAGPPVERDAPPKLPLTAEIEQRCAGTLGTWCVDYYTQSGVWAKTARRGNKTCSLDCNKASRGPGSASVQDMAWRL